MNRRERRQQARDTGSTRVTMMRTAVRFGGTVNVDGAAWGFIFNGRSVVAHRAMQIPDAMPRGTAEAHAELRNLLTAAAGYAFPLEVGDWRAMARAVSEEEARSGHKGNTEINVAGVSFPWREVSGALFMADETGHLTAHVIRTEKGTPVLRLDGPDLRVAILPWQPPPGAPGIGLLDAEQLDQLERDHASDAGPNDTNSNGGSA